MRRKSVTQKEPAEKVIKDIAAPHRDGFLPKKVPASPPTSSR